MKTLQSLQCLPLILSALFATSAFAQSAADEVQRNVNQQQRIEEGLKSGQLTTKEAARLEREQARISRTEKKALRDGTLDASEKARIANLQNQASRDIKAEKNDAAQGNPNSVSSQRMQADVQRNVNQQQRIENGIKDGSLTNQEVAKLERGQAKVEHREAAAGRNGHINAAEQGRIQNAENRQSKRVHHQRHDGQIRN